MTQWNHDKLLVLAQNHSTLYVCWTLSSWTMQLTERFFALHWEQLPKMIRIYDVTQLSFDGEHAHRRQDVPIGNGTNQWFVHNVWSDCHCIVDFGIVKQDGGFLTVLRSNLVAMPRQAESGPVAQHVYQNIDIAPAAKRTCAQPCTTGQGCLSNNWNEQFDGYSLRARA